MPKGRIKPPHISSHIEGRYVTLLVAPDLEWHLVLSHFYNSTSVAFSRSGFVWPQPWNSKWAGGPLLPRVSVARFVVSTDTEKMGVPRFSRFSRSGLSDSWHRKGLVLCGWRSNLHLEDLPLVDLDQPDLAEGISAETAPAPEFRGLHQATLHRVAVHVAQFLDTLVTTPDIEVVEAFLPDMLWSVFEQRRLGRIAASATEPERGAQSRV